MKNTLGQALVLTCLLGISGIVAQTAQDPVKLKDENWYPVLLEKLNHEDLADAADIRWERILSSTMPPPGSGADTSVLTAIKAKGKIQEKNISCFFQVPSEQNLLLIFIHHHQSHHVFLFDKNACSLNRVKNATAPFIIVQQGYLSLFSSDSKKIIFHDGDDKAWKEFVLDRKSNSIRYTRYCKKVNDRMMCEEIRSM